MHSISKMERRGAAGRDRAREGGREVWVWEAECHFQVSPRHFPLMRDGFCRGDQESPPHPPCLLFSPQHCCSDFQSSEELTALRWSPPPAQPHFRRHNNNKRSRRRICNGRRSASHPRRGAHHSQSERRAPPSHPCRISCRLSRSLSPRHFFFAIFHTMRDGEQRNS